MLSIYSTRLPQCLTNRATMTIWLFISSGHPFILLTLLSPAVANRRRSFYVGSSSTYHNAILCNAMFICVPLCNRLVGHGVRGYVDGDVAYSVDRVLMDIHEIP
jgi:hypothetical protein